jgi:hypothetical protein
MMKKWIIVCILFIVVYICGCLPWEKTKSIRLQYKYKEGDVLKYKVATISKGTITMTGLPEDASIHTIPSIGIKTKTECIFTQKVIRIEEGGVANIDISYDLCDMDIKIGKETLPPIFSKKQQNPFFKFMEGKKINIKIGRDGSLLEIKGIEELFEEMVAQMPNEVSDEFIHKFKEELEKCMIMSIEENYHRFPLEEMKRGDVWIREVDYNIPFFGTIYGKFTYTIQEFKQIKGFDCVKIDIDTDMNFGEEAPELFNIPYIDIEINGGVQGKGEMIFAYKEGKLLNTDLGMNMDMEVNYTGTIGEKETTMTMKLDFDTQTVVELQ